MITRSTFRCIPAVISVVNKGGMMVCHLYLYLPQVLSWDCNRDCPKIRKLTEVGLG